MAAKKVITPLANRIYLFNYFVKQETDDQTFVQSWLSTADFVATTDHYISAHLHNLTRPGAKYPWVNFAAFDSNDTCIFGKPDPGWKEQMRKGAKSGLVAVALPGEYVEVSSYNGNPLTDGPKERSDEKRFFLTAVTFEDTVSKDNLEANWASWMKTDFLQEKLGTKAADSLLYRLVKSVRNSPIRYTVRTEVSGITEEEGCALSDLADQQPCQPGVETFTGFYKIHTNMYHV